MRVAQLRDEASLSRGFALHARIIGRQVPSGRVQVSGAKNSATRLLAAAMLTNDTIVLDNFPTHLVDANHKMRFMRSAGAQVIVDDTRSQVSIRSAGLGTAPDDPAADYPIRTTYLLAAGQIRTAGFARIPYPGGCKIGSRGYDLHMMVWRALGCTVRETPAWIEIEGDGFVGGRINFPISTVGGTENALICAAIARGETEIANAYITPEVDDLIDLLRRMGARIEVFGNSLVRVVGTDRLIGTHKSVMPDRIEALTWVVLAILTGGSIQIDNVPFDHLQVPLLHLEKAGIDLYRNSSSIWVGPHCLRGGEVQPFELACGAHPGIISDMQAFFVLLGLVANGTSRIFDYRYPERVQVVHELAKLCGSGAVEAQVGKITTHGPARFKAAEVASTDLRGSMALVMAALAAEGESIVLDAHMALRGYNDLQGKLAQLGVTIDLL